MNVQPKIAQTGIPGFLLWARQDNPALYKAMVAEIPEVSAFNNALLVEGMGGFGDVLASVGGALASSAGKIANFVKTNAVGILSAAVPVVIAKKQADVAKAQIKLAVAQQAPMQTQLVQSAGGQVMAVPLQQQTIAASSGAPQLNTRLLGVPLWAWLAGGFGVAMWLSTRRR